MAGELTGGWYMSRGGVTYGPYEWTFLAAWAREGRLSPDDVVWQPRLAGWVPARQVPGLFPAGFAPIGSVAPNRRRLSGLAIVAICLATVIVLGGAGAGAWLALRGNDGGGPTAGTPTAATTTDAQTTGDTLPDVNTGTLSLGGTVVLPEGSALTLSDLSVLSDTDKKACSASGEFAVPAVHDEGARTPVFVMNGQGNPVLMALVDSSNSAMKPSVASTARALVLYDPTMQSLPKSVVDSAIEKLESHADLPALEAAVKNAVLSDPVTPLDPETHADLYDQAAKIEADLLAQVLPRNEQTSGGTAWDQSAPVVLAAAGDLGQASLFQAPAGGTFAYVKDDPDHLTPEVTLGNTTWAIYDVNWTSTTKDGATSGKEILWRCAPWRVDASSFELSLTPFGFKYEKLAKLGDGELTFDFKRNDQYMMISVGADMLSLTLGVGAGSLNKMVRDESNAAAILNTSGALLKAMAQFQATCESIQGKSFDEAAVIVGKYFATHGSMIILAAMPLVQEELKEELITVAGTVITKKMATLATLGYGAADLLAECHALGNAAIVSYSTSGRQAANYYPFSVDLTFQAKQKDPTTFVFPVTISGFPTDFPQSTELEITYGDGETEQEEPNIEAGMAAVTFRHTYKGKAPPQAQLVFRTKSGNPVVLVSKEADLVTETTTTAASGINGTWAGVEKLAGTDFATLEITFKIGPDGTGTASRGAAGIGVVSFPATFKGGVVTVEYQGATLVGQMTGPNSMVISGKIEGTDYGWELKRQTY